MKSSFRMEDKNITMIRGDTLSFGIELYDENGNLLNNNDIEIYFTCRSNKYQNRNVFQRSYRKSGGSSSYTGIVPAGTGKYTVRVAPDTTNNVEPGKYRYDLQFKINSDVFTMLHGILEIVEDVTR